MNSLKNKTVIYSLAFALCTIILGSCYYLFTIFSKKEEFTDEDNAEIEEMKQEIEESNNGEIIKEMVVRIYCLSQKISEKKIKEKIKEMETIRRNLINNDMTYIKQCEKIYDYKNQSNQKFLQLILDKFNLSSKDYFKIMNKVTQNELEIIINDYDYQIYAERKGLDKNTTIEAYKYYCELHINEYEKYKNDRVQNKVNNNELVFKLICMKMKIEDLLYIKYGINEHRLKYLCFEEYNLLEDDIVKSLYDKLIKYSININANKNN